MAKDAIKYKEERQSLNGDAFAVNCVSYCRCSEIFVDCLLTACIFILLLILYYSISLILDYNKKDVVHHIHLIKICSEKPRNILKTILWSENTRNPPYISAVYLNEEHQIHHNVTYQHPGPKLKVLRATLLLI